MDSGGILIEGPIKELTKKKKKKEKKTHTPVVMDTCSNKLFDVALW